MKDRFLPTEKSFTALPNGAAVNRPGRKASLYYTNPAGLPGGIPGRSESQCVVVESRTIRRASRRDSRAIGEPVCSSGKPNDPPDKPAGFV